MVLSSSRIGFAAVITCCLSLSTPVFSQEISASHLAAARSAVAATHATDSFDSILFNTSSKLKNELIAKNPDKADQISAVVDEEAIALAPRRADLEKEVATQFANNFSESELNEIATFFKSTAGTKYLQQAPVLARQLGKSARIWAVGITRDLTTNVNNKLKDIVK